MLYLINSSNVTEGSFDVSSGASPAERLRVLIPVHEPTGDRPFEAPDAVEAAAADGLAGDQGEPAFDQVEPGGAGRREVQMKAWMSCQPCSDRRVLVVP